MEKENKTGIQELKNEAVEEAMKAFLADKTNPDPAGQSDCKKCGKVPDDRGLCRTEKCKRENKNITYHGS